MNAKDKFKHRFTRGLKVLKGILQNIYKVITPVINKIIGFILKFIKITFRYLLSIRVGIRPEFKRWLRGVKSEGIKGVFGKGGEVTSQSHPRDIRSYFSIRHLKILSRKLKLVKLTSIVFPILFAVLILNRVSPISAQLTGYEERLNGYLLENDVVVGVEKDTNLNDQIYFVFEGEKNFVTDSTNAKGGENTQGEYITWMETIDGNWQIILYHIPTETRTQLTYAGNNVNPLVSDGKVVWEGIRVNENWQVYLYDGSMMGPISSGDASFKPDINGNFIVYSRKDINEQWRSTAYSINDRENVDIDFGEKNKYVRLKNKDIIIGYEGDQKKFSLNVEDLMLLELGALSSQSSATIESVQEEIELLMGEGQ